MSTSIVKLFVYEAVKCEGINVDYLRKDLPVNNSAIMVKWKCLKLLYSSKGMCRIDSQLKKIDTFEIFNSWNTLYLFVYIGERAVPSITRIAFENLPNFCLLNQLNEKHRHRQNCWLNVTREETSNSIRDTLKAHFY